MPAASANAPFSSTTTSPNPDGADLEPDDEWKLQLRKRIEEGLQSMVADAKENMAAELRKSPDTPETRLRIDASYKQAMQTIKGLATEQYLLELDRERNKLRWTAGVPMNPGWTQYFIEEKQNIMDSIKQSSNQTDNSARTVRSPSNERRPVISKPSTEPPALAPLPVLQPVPFNPSPRPTEERKRSSTSPQSVRRASDARSTLSRGRDEPHGSFRRAPDTGEDILRPVPPRARLSSTYMSSQPSPVSPAKRDSFISRSSGSIHSAGRHLARSPPGPPPEVWKPTISPAGDALPPKTFKLERRGSATPMKSTGSGASYRPSITETIPERADEGLDESAIEKIDHGEMIEQGGTISTDRPREKEKRPHLRRNSPQPHVGIDDDNRDTDRRGEQEREGLWKRDYDRDRDCDGGRDICSGQRGGTPPNSARPALSHQIRPWDDGYIRENEYSRRYSPAGSIPIPRHTPSLKLPSAWRDSPHDDHPNFGGRETDSSHRGNSTVADGHDSDEDTDSEDSDSSEDKANKAQDLEARREGARKREELKKEEARKREEERKEEADLERKRRMEEAKRKEAQKEEARRKTEELREEERRQTAVKLEEDTARTKRILQLEYQRFTENTLIIQQELNKIVEEVRKKEMEMKEMEDILRRREEEAEIEAKRVRDLETKIQKLEEGKREAEDELDKIKIELQRLIDEAARGDEERKEEEARRREEDARKKEEEIHEKEGEVKRREQEAVKKEQDAEKREDAVKWKEEEAMRKAEELSRTEEEVMQRTAKIEEDTERARRMQMEAQKIHEDVKKLEEEARKKEIEMKEWAAQLQEDTEKTKQMQSETQKFAEDTQKKHDDVKKMEEEVCKKETQMRDWATRLEEDSKKLHLEAQRITEDALKKQDDPKEMDDLMRREVDSLRVGKGVEKVAMAREEPAVRGGNTFVAGGTFYKADMIRIDGSGKSPTDKGITKLLSNAAPGAFHDSRELSDPLIVERHPNNRVAAIQEIFDWLDDPKSELVMWLHGATGAGKSAIAQTVAQMLFEQGRLSGSFFFARGSTTGRADERRLVPSLAYQLAGYLPDTRFHIATTVVSNPVIFDLALGRQVRDLLINPLGVASNAASSSASSRLFIMDGLDECRDADTQLRILQVFATAVESTQHRLPHKLLITSRSEMHLLAGFNNTATTYRQLSLDNFYRLSG